MRKKRNIPLGKPAWLARAERLDAIRQKRVERYREYKRQVREEFYRDAVEAYLDDGNGLAYTALFANSAALERHAAARGMTIIDSWRPARPPREPDLFDDIQQGGNS